HIHAKPVELVRQTQLFLVVHAAAGRLLAVAQGGIEHGDAGSVAHGFSQRLTLGRTLYGTSLPDRRKTYNYLLGISKNYIISTANGLWTSHKGSSPGGLDTWNSRNLKSS